jgi:hypothetical protein
MKKLIYENDNIGVGKYKRKVVRSYETKDYYEANGWHTSQIYEDEEADLEENELEIIMYRKETLLDK